MKKAHVENYNGSPAIVIDGRPYAPMLATIRTNNRSDMVIDKEYYRKLGESGIKVYFLICDTEWLKPGAFAQFRKEAEILLEVVPDAYIIPRIGLHPPVSWIEAHPEECVTYNDGKGRPCLLYSESYVKELPAMYSLCSSVWREDAGKALLDTMKQMDRLPYADRIVGFFLAAGGTSEWYYITHWFLSDGSYGDFSEAFRREYEKYLREKYGTVEKLRAAWNDPTATFEYPRMPVPSELSYQSELEHAFCNPPHLYSTDPAPLPPKTPNRIGTFLDVNTCQYAADFFRAKHIGTANSVIYFANVIKNYSRDLMVGAFYGSWGCTEYFESGTAAGTLKIMDSGVVDFLAAPGVYENRQPGGFTGQREMNDAFRLRGQMFIVEEDTRTHAENAHYANYAETFTMEDTFNIMKRDFGRNICEDLQAWWFDQHLGGGRYKYPEVYGLISRQQEIAKEFYETDRTKPHEIAFIYDEESPHLSSKMSTMESVELIRNYEIAHIGVPVDQYYHNDMARADMPDYKLYVFMNTYSLTDKERAEIRAKLKKTHATALFLYGAGFINPDKTDTKMSPDNISDFTGITMAMKDDWIAPKFKIDRNSKNPVITGCDKGNIYGWLCRKMRRSIAPVERTGFPVISPIFYADDTAADNCAYYCSNRLPAVSVKDNDDFKAVYCGAKYVRADFFRSVAEAAGCHVSMRSDDVAYIGSHYITLHASESGRKTLYFEKPCSPVEVYENECYGENVTEISFDMLMGDTKMFRF